MVDDETSDEGFNLGEVRRSPSPQHDVLNSEVSIEL